MHWKQHQVFILEKHEQMRSTRLLECDGNRASTESSIQFGCPGFHRFRFVYQFALFHARRRRTLQRAGVLLLCPIDSDIGSKLDLSLVCVSHSSSGLFLPASSLCSREMHIEKSALIGSTTSECSFWKQRHPAARKLVKRRRDVAGSCS